MTDTVCAPEGHLPLSLPLKVIYEHRDWLALHKPQGIAVQRGADEDIHQPTLLTMACQQFNMPKLWLVHRLDKATSGLIILAKHAQAAATFSQLFAERAMQKYYLAIGSKKPKQKQGWVKGDMKKVRDGQWLLQKSQDNPAVTQFFSCGLSGKRLFALRLYSGKTHQIRVALKSIGSPVLGDSLYGGTTADRMYLHALQLLFTYNGEHFHLTCPPAEGALFHDPEFVSAFANYQNPSQLPWRS